MNVPRSWQYEKSFYAFFPFNLSTLNVIVIECEWFVWQTGFGSNTTMNLLLVYPCHQLLNFHIFSALSRARKCSRWEGKNIYWNIIYNSTFIRRQSGLNNNQWSRRSSQVSGGKKSFEPSLAKVFFLIGSSSRLPFLFPFVDIKNLNYGNTKAQNSLLAGCLAET